MQVELAIPGAESLKDRRRVVKSVTDRLRRRFGAAVAEVGTADDWHTANIDVAPISRDGKLIRSLATRVRNFVENLREAEMTDLQTEFL